ncbi:MAG: hypothetical protein ACYDBJ_25460 [Aggregatilineales bacterium]
MNNPINLQIFTQTSFDSGSLGGLGAVIHRFDQPGEHRITVLQAEKVIQTLGLKVTDIARQLPANAQPTSGAAPASSSPTAVHVDLSGALSPIADLTPQSYALFHAPQGIGGFAVQIHASGVDNQPPIFDSRKLQSNDIFTVTLLRPGRYSLTNAGKLAKGEIRVSYPVIGATAYRPPDPVTVQVTAQGFHPHAIQLQPAQGLIFHIRDVAARIQIDLVEPDDGPGGAAGSPGGRPKPLYRWEKPVPPSSKPQSK